MTSTTSYAKTAAILGWMTLVGGKGEFKDLKQKTAMVLENEIPRDVCEDICKRIDAMASQEADDRVWSDSIGSDTRILAFEGVIPEYLQYLKIPERIRAIDDYLGTKTRSWFLMANRVLPKPGNLGSGGGLHRDSPYSHQVKCIWYLSDVAKENGPFQFVPGSHYSVFGDRHKYPLGKYRFESVQDELVAVTAPAGSLLVADVKCIHAGKPIESGSRYALTLYTYKSAEKSRASYREQGVDPARVQPEIS